MNLPVKTKYILIVVFLLSCSLLLIKFTKSAFSDTEKIAGNSLQVGVWGENVPTLTPTPLQEQPTPTPVESTPTPTPTATSNIVINEVFYRVDNNHKINNSESGSEWVELYNPTTGDINLSGWSMEDNTSCDTFLGNPIIPAGSFAIISTHTETDFRNVWTTIPLGVIFIQSPTAIGNGLANNDELKLHNQPCGIPSVIDFISWGSNTNGLNPSIPMVDLGHSSERNPSGLDTDTASDFIDRSVPTPGN